MSIPYLRKRREATHAHGEPGCSPPGGRERGSSHRRRRSSVRRGSRWRQRSQARHGPEDATLDLLEDLLHLWCRRRRAVNGAVGIAVVAPAKTIARNDSVSKARAMGGPVERRARDALGTYIRSDLPPVDDCMRRAWLFINSSISFDEATPSASPPSTKPHLAVVGSNTDAPAMVFWAVALAGMAFSQSVYTAADQNAFSSPKLRIRLRSSLPPLVSQSVISRSRPALTPPPALSPAPPLPV